MDLARGAEHCPIGRHRQEQNCPTFVMHAYHLVPKPLLRSR